MELHQLRYFRAVADLGSFSRAAEKCFVAQPSLSQQVIKLERELGRPLFDRLGRRVQLTEAGRALYAQAATILAAVDEIRERVTAATEPGRGTVVVGAIPTVAPYLLPPVLEGFARRFPRAAVDLQEDLTDATTRGCLAGELDLGVIAGPAADPNLESEALFTEELRLALPPGHRLGRKRLVRFADLVAEPFVLLNEMHCLGEQVLGFCTQQGCSPIVRCRSVQLLTIQELVASGHGVSLIPASACDADRGRRCEYRTVREPTPTRTLRVIWRKDRYRPPVVQEFLDELRAASIARPAR